ncbi:MAG TPA: ACP phosphodiesterase [Rhodanobacteraceae bacterium]|jgi:acyl carrier protein phosphodiesterase|nr:ACP phosphodiesterase [Rhodanobacteraceae bacterium]
MNHLAHALLADAGGAEFALGSAEGDFVHGHPDPAWPAARQAGLRFHRAIDQYTDRHAEVVAARNLFTPPLRRYAGIVLDIWFDHLLVRGWDRCNADEPLPRFAQRWLALLDARAADLPESLCAFTAWMHAHGLPEAYGDDATLDVVFHALAKRLSRPSPIGDALPALRERADALQRHFDAFFPDLVVRARGLRHDLSA